MKGFVVVAGELSRRWRVFAIGVNSARCRDSCIYVSLRERHL
jgi:hypothetical protein